jgi:hypothetical protein
MSREKVKAAIKTLYQPGDTVEVRAFKPGEKPFVGRFKYGRPLVDMIVFADEEMECDVYLCLNPTKLPPTDQWLTGIEATKEPEVVTRRWFLLDGDPLRDFIRDADGNPILYPVMRKNEPVLNADGTQKMETKRHKVATDAEWQAAHDAMTAARQWLIGRGWKPEDVVIASSGNGVHLLVRCNLPNDDTAKKLITAVQRAVSTQFSTDAVEIECFPDGDRLVRAYGTVNKKGKQSTGRTYRESGLL